MPVSCWRQEALADRAPPPPFHALTCEEQTLNRVQSSTVLVQGYSRGTDTRFEIRDGLGITLLDVSCCMVHGNEPRNRRKY